MTTPDFEQAFDRADWELVLNPKHTWDEFKAAILAAHNSELEKVKSSYEADKAEAIRQAVVAELEALDGKTEFVKFDDGRGPHGLALPRIVLTRRRNEIKEATK